MMNFRLPLSKERDEIGGSYYKHRKVFAVTCNLDQKLSREKTYLCLKERQHMTSMRSNNI